MGKAGNLVVINGFSNFYNMVQLKQREDVGPSHERGVALEVNDFVLEIVRDVRLTCCSLGLLCNTKKMHRGPFPSYTSFPTL